MMLEGKLGQLDTILRGAPKLLVAYSGGVDSAFLMERARGVLGAGCLGVLADSPSLARRERAAALALAEARGWCVEVVETGELGQESYAANPPDRCFFCKQELFVVMEALAQERGFSALAYGENADDMRVDRPGRRAAEALRVLAPLRDAGLTKAEIREASARLGLPTSDKPASPCLASRIPHGTRVTSEALAAVEAAEGALQELGFRILRVRYHGELAKIELGRAEHPLWHEREQEAVSAVRRRAGFRQIELSPTPYGESP